MANKKDKEEAKPFKWKHAVGENILWLATWYCRYALSYEAPKKTKLHAIKYLNNRMKNDQKIQNKNCVIANVNNHL